MTHYLRLFVFLRFSVVRFLSFLLDVLRRILPALLVGGLMIIEFALANLFANSSGV